MPPPPDFVGIYDVPADSSSVDAPLSPPTDTASLPDDDFADLPFDEVGLPGDAGEPYDPYEQMNRSNLERNQRFYRTVVLPLAKGYQTVPQPARTGLENFVSNLAEPMVFANNVLQLRLGAAATTASRFALNSTIGVAGVADVASTQDLPRQSGDFGQTLYVWGVRESPYLVVPVIGPTNARDLFGNAVEIVAMLPAGGLVPSQYASAANNLSVVGTVATPITKLDEVAQLQDLEESSLDFYTMLRSVVEQKRQAELQEAIQTSGWTAGRYRNGSESTFTVPESALLASFGRRPSPTTPSGQFMASAFTGSHE
jgi:ABC-type transporter lipoprotein component MlaA